MRRVYCKVENDNGALEAERWGIYKGFPIVLQESFKSVQIKTDAEVVVEIIQDRPLQELHSKR